MDYLRQIEEDLRNIGIEAKLKKKYPEVLDSSERALDALKAIREVYVSEIMRKNKSAKLPQSSDILAPYLLVCNYAEGSAKVTLMALNGINLLLTYDLVPPSDVKNIMRALSIQASSKIVDVQLKLLQVVLQLANSLAQNADSTQYLTESIFCGFLTLALQLCDSGSKSNTLSVSSTALGTARQIIAFVMDGAKALFLFTGGGDSNVTADAEVNVDQASSKYSLTAIMLVREMCLFIQGLPGEWIRGVTMPQAYALDLLTEILTEWKELFRKVPFFKALIRDSVFPALKPLLKGLQEEYVRAAVKSASAAAQLVSKVVKLARCLLLNFVADACKDAHASHDHGVEASNLNSEASFIISMLVHALQPDRAGGGGAHGGGVAQAGDDQTGAQNATAPAESTFKSRWEEASSVVAGAGMFLSRLTNPSAASSASAPSPVSGGSSAADQKLQRGNSKGSANASLGALGGSGNGFYLSLAGPSGGAAGVPFNSATAAALLASAGGTGSSWLGGGAGAVQLPAFPALCCLEALLAFLLSDLSALLADTGLGAAPAPAHEVSSGATPGATPSKHGSNNSDSDHRCKAGSGMHLFEVLLTNTLLGLCTFLQSALATDTNLRELEAALKGSSALSKLLRGLLNGSNDHDKGEGASAGATGAGAVFSADKQIRSVHELVHGSAQGINVSSPTDLLMIALYLFQFIPRMMLTLSLQLATGGEHRPKSSLRRSNSSSSNTGDRRVFLSSAVVMLINPSTHKSAAAKTIASKDGPFALPKLLKADPTLGTALRSCISRVCDSVYESTLDTSSLLLNAAGDAALVRAALGIVAELAILSGTMDLPKQCDIIISVLCKYTVPMWHGQELYGAGALSADLDPAAEGTPRGFAAASKRESAIRWRHFQAFVRLAQVIHLIADAVPDWDNIVDSFEQLVDYFTNSKSPHAFGAPDLKSTDSGAGAGMLGASDKELFLPEVEKIFTAIERFKTYSVFLSDEGLVRLTTSLVALSMNHLAVNASSSNMSSNNLDGENSDGSNSDIIQVNSSPFASGGAASSGGMVGGAGAGTSSAVGVAGNSGVCRVRPESSSAGLPYMNEGIRNGTISFSLQALIEITKLNAFRISTIWQMVISHLRMIASLKSANSRAISVAATHDVILSSMRYQQLCVNPITGLSFLQDEAPTPHSLALGAAATDPVEDKQCSLIMSDELLFNFVLPSFDTVFIGRDIHRIGLEGRDDRLSSRPALSQNDLLSSLKALSSVRYSDVRSAIIEGLAHLLQGRGQIIRGGSSGGWPVILDLISSVPLSMANPAIVPYSDSAAAPSSTPHWVYGSDELLEGGDADDDVSMIPSTDNLAALDAEALSTLPETPGGGAGAKGTTVNGAMASLSAAGVIPQYQWPLESLVSAFTCMKLIVDEFFEVLVADCELVSAVLHGLALFGSQVKDANISLTSVEMLWKVTDLAITFARSNHELRLADNVITSQHYVAVVFDIMLKRLFQLSMDPQPLIRHCAMNTLFSAMSTHAPIISAEQWQQVFGNIIFPLFERAGARSRIAMWSKEEAIAPELKKGVKMSVHHSRDTAHKQWSETRVIALRGLSRVLRTCTRLLLQESWFRVIWVDALNVCQGALQAACDEQEVSIAALDVVFTMLRIIIQTDSTNPAGASDAAMVPAEKPAVHTLNRTNSKLAAAAAATAMPSVPALSKDEVENIEKCKLALWQLTWTAVRTTAFFTCNSVELALAISQKLKELYRTRIDHEFRYSDNVRVLLEILVALVRPRVGILRGTVTSASVGAALPDLITQKQDRVAESQLQRAVIDLLCVIQPADGLAQSCLMSTLTEICFSVLWVQVPVAPQSEATDLNKPLAPAGADSEWLILGAAPERLRKEAGEHLGRLLVLQFASEDTATSTAIESSSPTKSPVATKLFPWATASTPFISLMIDIVVRRFVADICEGPLVARCHTAVLSTPASVATDGLKSTSSDVAATPSAGFFAAFGSIMSSFSSPTAQNLQPVYAKHVGAGHSAPVIASARIAGGTLHKFVKYIPVAESKALPDCTPCALSLTGPHSTSEGSVEGIVEWRTFYLVDTELKLLLASVQACYSLMSHPYADSKALSSSASGGSGVEVMTEAVWNSLLTATACLLSPWRSSELCSKSSPLDSAVSSNSNTTSRVVLSDPAALPSADIVNILKVSLKIVDFMRYPSAVTVQWTDILVRSTVLGIHVLGEACATAPLGSSASLHAVSEFYQGLWLQVASILGSLLAAEEDADLAVRSRALWGTIEIANASIRAVLRVASSAQHQEMPHALLVICEEFLHLLLRSASTPAMMALVGSIEAPAADNGTPAVDALVAAWMQSSKVQVQARETSKTDASKSAGAKGAAASAGKSGAGSATKPRKSVTTGSGEGSPGMAPTSAEAETSSASPSRPSSVAEKGHVVLLLPLCLDLVLSSCSAPDLKAVAVSLIKSVDLVQLSNSVQVLTSEAEQLRARNRKLENDMAALRSANTLPF